MNSATSSQLECYILPVRWIIQLAAQAVRQQCVMTSKPGARRGITIIKIENRGSLTVAPFSYLFLSVHSRNIHLTGRTSGQCLRLRSYLSAPLPSCVVCRGPAPATATQILFKRSSPGQSLLEETIRLGTRKGRSIIGGLGIHRQLGGPVASG